MAVKVAINGFGRIGRLALRRILETESDLEVVAVNDLTDNENLAYLLKYDTAHGRFPYSVELTDNGFLVDGKEIKSYEEKDANDLPWGDLGIDIVLECTGFYTSAEKSQAHINAGAKRVLISAPAKDAETKMIVYGVNEDTISSDDTIISAASCTTNSLAPVVKVLQDNYGIKTGNMVTVHAYTATQPTQDSPNAKSYRSGRAAAQNIIPASTGAAKAIGRVIPEVNGLLDGSALRVPTVTGSHTIMYSLLNKNVSVEEINEAMKAASTDSFAYNEDEIVSSDIIGFHAGSIFDATLTEIQEAEDGSQLVKTVAWYDNEAGFVSNMVRLLEKFATL
ncbi:type I glyceraldehyde-3-phosphate dehydrogenase [Aerococcus kribbianus]|uniref:Glyceraldehyde-3-phosphate dehydrogenase n=1 Tax=Aerococcus kribbianus TaxID=2999064 RepID=A0A9X3FLY5_9LACT|nr:MULTISPECIES: type I glyceraldehyde-3-phosphate dehydrogenase [unclassified Aerococcus]MCZ0716967.1 type I glyceraldehyde-3-phosphate dehydrogenase [Aerococcus sp. YH-aer221]MCZ0725255.1 type I glyceraldehyde-3-phosphate dehydrogenase [Aerococcus sp. YH-aer222]